MSKDVFDRVVGIVDDIMKVTEQDVRDIAEGNGIATPEEVEAAIRGLKEYQAPAPMTFEEAKVALREVAGKMAHTISFEARMFTGMEEEHEYYLWVHSPLGEHGVAGRGPTPEAALTNPKAQLGVPA